jgi:hypothetical protein
MNKITNITRKEIFDVLLNTYTEDYLFGNPGRRFIFWGTLMPADFLGRLYDLEKIPPKTNHYKNAKEELESLTSVARANCQPDWLFNDDRFPVKNGTDEELLDFLCTVLHPEVRDEKVQEFGTPLWQRVWEKLNMLVANDGYTITIDGSISNHVVFSWYDLTKQSLRTIEEGDITPFINLFVRNGYVLNFSTAEFNKFTKKIVGVELCSIYRNSKGKSLIQFLHEGKDEDIKALLSKLFEHYENDAQYENERKKDSHYSNLYKICKKKVRKFNLSNTVIESYAKELTKKFSGDYMSSQMTLMIEMQKKNPTEAIGKAKELIESCCTTILEERNEKVGGDCTVLQLVKATMKVLKITPKDIPDETPESQAMKALLGNLAVIAQSLATLRNKYGSGHGKSADYKGLEERHAKLAIGSAVTLVDFLWTSHNMI